MTDSQQKLTKLIDLFIAEKLNADEFCDSYFPAWRYLRDNEDKNIDVTTLDEKTNKFHAMKDQVFAACDVYTPYPENVYEIDAQGLLSEVTRIYQAYLRSN